MSSKIKKIMIFISILGFSYVTHARSSAESFLMLREAIMKSNKDYNQHKKKSNFDEFDRIGKWGERDSSTIVINDLSASKENLAELTQSSSRGREVSSNKN